MLLREDLAARLELLEARLAEQLQEAEDIRAQIGAIRAQLQGTDAAYAPDSSHSGPQTPAEKVALFRSLFCGREDVYPRLWVSAKRDRKGYSPVCANEGNHRRGGPWLALNYVRAGRPRPLKKSCWKL